MSVDLFQAYIDVRRSPSKDKIEPLQDYFKAYLASKGYQGSKLGVRPFFYSQQHAVSATSGYFDPLGSSAAWGIANDKWDKQRFYLFGKLQISVGVYMEPGMVGVVGETQVAVCSVNELSAGAPVAFNIHHDYSTLDDVPSKPYEFNGMFNAVYIASANAKTVEVGIFFDGIVISI